MRHLFTFLLVLFAGFAQAAPGSPFETKPDFLPVGKAFAFTSERLESGETQLFWQIADGYYLYQQRMKFDGLAEKPVLPEGEAHSDEFFGEQQVYRQGLEVKIPAGTTGQVKTRLAGLRRCGPVLSAAVDHRGPGRQPGRRRHRAGPGSKPGQRPAAAQPGVEPAGVLRPGPAVGVAPCSLPMLPILAGLVVGSGASPRRGFALAGSYVVCMALVYAALG